MRGTERRIKRREAPLKRVNPSGEVVWVARYTDSIGKRRFAKPAWNNFKATFKLKRDAQRAIDEAYELPERFDTFGSYAQTWTDRHPRSERTDATNRGRVNALLDVEVEGRPLRDWPYHELRRRHMAALVDHMLRVQRRAAKGVVGIRNTVSAMTEDAITDEVAEVNFAKGVKVRANDPRVQKPPKRARIWTFDHLREFAEAARAEVRAETLRPAKHRQTGDDLYFSKVNYEPMVLTFTLTNLRAGEVFAILRANLDVDEGLLKVVGSAYEGRIIEGDSPEKRHVREVPIAPSLAAVLRQLPPRIDTSVLFPTPSGSVWRYSNFARDVWKATQIASGMDLRPHECRHSYVTHLRAAGIDPADLAQVTGHDIDTATRHYTQPLGRSMEAIRKVIG